MSEVTLISCCICSGRRHLSTVNAVSLIVRPEPNHWHKLLISIDCICPIADVVVDYSLRGRRAAIMLVFPARGIDTACW